MRSAQKRGGRHHPMPSAPNLFKRTVVLSDAYEIVSDLADFTSVF
jgi:hypothetical protein